jgi:hypothetical protein
MKSLEQDLKLFEDKMNKFAIDPIKCNVFDKIKSKRCIGFIIDTIKWITDDLIAH